jgi:hypothetical protein
LLCKLLRGVLLLGGVKDELGNRQCCDQLLAAR